MSNFLLEAGRQTLQLELQEASRLPERLGDDFIRAAETIIHCEGKLVVSGIGKSGHIGKKLAATFASTGTPAFFVHPAEALHGDLGMLDSRDVMLFISYSGSAKELDLIVPRLEEKSIPLLAMTGKSTSPLALAAKAVLDIAVEREACPMHLAPTSSTVRPLHLPTAAPAVSIRITPASISSRIRADTRPVRVALALSARSICPASVISSPARWRMKSASLTSWNKSPIRADKRP